MEKMFDIALRNRQIIAKILENTPQELLLKIPEGFRNNIWWNIAHVIVTQQLLVYKMSNLPMRISDEFANKFKKGTVPNGTATADEIATVKSLLFSTVEGLQEDYNNKIFKEYNEYTTSLDVTLKSADDAIALTLFHDGLHLGAILALQKAVAK